MFLHVTSAELGHYDLIACRARSMVLYRVLPRTVVNLRASLSKLSVSQMINPVETRRRGFREVYFNDDSRGV